VGSALLTAGVDIGGTKLLAVAADGQGKVVAERRQPTAEGPDAVLAATAAVVADLLAAEPGIAAVGVGLPGLVDLEGAVHYAPNLPGFVGVDARGRLAATCAVPVVVDNDANVAALGEVLHGAGRGRKEVLVVTLGTGIGGGLIINGVVNRGGYGLAAEIGHFTVDRNGPVCACGARGHWEALASGSALGRRAREWAARGDAPGVLARAGGVVEAVTGHEELGQPFELARSLMARGRGFRRALRKRPARESLERALAIFENLGASAWADRARSELGRIGGRATSSTALTSTEGRVAALAAQGRTNREIADQLFMTVRTVEWNLSKVYRKLQVRSRTELSRAVDRA